MHCLALHTRSNPAPGIAAAAPRMRSGFTAAAHARAAIMKIEGYACQLTVLIGEDDRYHHHPLYVEIVHRAHAAGLAGASVFRGIEGYGKASHIHTSRILSLSEDLPIAVTIIDGEERIREFLPQLDEIVDEGLVLIDQVEVTRYVSGTRIR